MKRETVPSTPDSLSATNCGRSIFSANAVLEAKTASTPSLLGDQLSTTPRYSVCNLHFPGTKSLLSTPQFLPNLLKESIELTPRSSELSLQDFILVDPPIFTRGLPGGSPKTRLAGHRRGRPPHLYCEHSWQEVLLRQNYGRRGGRPPRPTLLLPWSNRPKGHRRGCPPDNYPSLDTPSLHDL